MSKFKRRQTHRLLGGPSFMKHIKCTLWVAFVLTLAACAPGQENKQTGGTLAGAYLGSEVGKSVDQADRLGMKQTAQTAFEKNIEWADVGMVKSGLGKQWQPDADADLSDRLRQFMPGIPANSHYRRQDRASVRARLPPTRR